MSREDEIEKLKEEIKNTKYNKATQYHIGRIKAKISRLEEAASKSGGKGGDPGRGYSIRKSGDATVLLVGPPSAGKSTLLNRITSAESKTGGYQFTTLDVIPGTMEYNSARIQVLDVPGLVEGAACGKGRGKEVLSVARNADLILIIIEKMSQLHTVGNELYSAGFRLDAKRPQVLVKKRDRGGLKLTATPRLKKIDKKMVQVVLNERGIHNAEVAIREDVSLDELVDSVSPNRIYVKSLVVFNKTDLLSGEELKAIPADFVKLSSLTGEGIEDLKRRIWQSLGLMRIYMKKKGKGPDLEEPLITGKGSRVIDVARKIHREFAAKLDYARIWGPSAKFEGQKVGKDKVLDDRDIVELHFESI